jgi:hypothetical protein
MVGENVMDILHGGMGFQPFLPREEAFWPLFRFLGRRTTSPASGMILYPEAPSCKESNDAMHAFLEDAAVRRTVLDQALGLYICKRVT